jgi:hypothetical protein
VIPALGVRLIIISILYRKLAALFSLIITGR